jgi:opacity protein-like surface antigen
MKKLILLAAFVIGATFYNQAEAQTISDNALGLRFGGGDGVGAEISYQRALGTDNNRLELDLGWRDNSKYDAFKLTGIYQWVWNIEGGFNWYVGAGAGILGVDANREFRDEDSGTYLFLAGDIGIEYNFDIPLLISLDFRPEFGFFSDNAVLNDFSPDIALGVRYQF